MDIKMFSEKIDNYNIEFKNIFIIMNDIFIKKDIIHSNINSLKIQYNQLIKLNNKKLYLLSLDSFFFQYKYFFMELEQIDNSRKLVINRMYCEYYKLYKNILNYFDEIKLNYEKENDNIKSFPIYKDLEPLYEYSLDDINIIFNNVIILLTILNDFLLKNYEHISNYNQEYKIGFSIFNFTNTMKNENLNIENQLNLFLDFIRFFLYSHKKYIEQILFRYSELFKNIDEIILYKDFVTPNSIENIDLSNNNFEIKIIEEEIELL
jgi:hypothetical protein